MTKKQKQKKQKSVVLKTFGALKGIRPALPSQQERKAAEEVIAEKAIKRMGGRVQHTPGTRRV
jgi:hypothetical protein